ncbi:MAG TPA: ADP-glyceromanno-heptose 6-epimerase, partial [Bacteroidota bacterium]|nr:ADP-glyceromanno-heptose 6-epimerase [Bacteroidota bacterium]
TDYPLTASKLVNWLGLKHFHFLEHLEFLKALEEDRLSPDAIFHLGACSSTTETDWKYLQRNNIEYSQHLWNWCARKKKPFIYASSAATYGNGSSGYDDRTPPERLQPLNLYGRSKNEFDQWVLKHIFDGKQSPPRWAGLKFFNVYGPRESHKGAMASVVWKAYRQIETVGEVSLFRSNDPAIRDGEQKRDFVFVEDCIDHMLWLLQFPHVAGVYNSGTGEARTFLDLVRAVFTALNKKPRIRFVDMPAGLSAQYQNFTEAVMTKLRTAGYNKKATSLEEGVAKYISSLQMNSSESFKGNS